ncbi:MAG: hypothetical protein ACRDWY_13925, partial [Actinomycetes bacterium]
LGDGEWRTVARSRLDGDGRFDLVARQTSRRTTSWRVVVPAPPTGGLSAGRSRTVELRVR